MLPAGNLVLRYHAGCLPLFLPAMTTVTGPVFQFVEEVDAGQRHTIGGFGARTRPLLVKGALNRWPARHNWSFEQMAALRY